MRKHRAHLRCVRAPCAPASGTEAECEHTCADAEHGRASECVERLEHLYVDTGAPRHDTVQEVCALAPKC
eukprot:12556133-Alexandrium_andersonii.AAC.1